MTCFDVCEKFVSINGEGRRAGELAVFVRFKGCGLACSYCDTRWANSADAESERLGAVEICEYVRSSGVKNVTLTGGEPLMREGMGALLVMLKAIGASVEIETNGAVDISPYCGADMRPDCFTVDYKLPRSGMEDKMLTSNFDLLGENDCVKFVAGDRGDLGRALEVMRKYALIGRCHVYISPVFGSIEPAEIVDFMKENKLSDVRLQIQMHKVIWDKDKRGV